MVGAVADARDAVQALVNGDMLGAALNAVGAIPGPGDAAKVSGVVALFIKVNPGKANELAKVLLKVFKNYAPSVVIFALDIIYKGAATALKGKDVTIDKMGELLDKGVDLVKLNKALDKAKNIPWIGDVGYEDIIHILENKCVIEQTLVIIKRSDGSVRWLEEGTIGWGWIHITRSERFSQITDVFGSKTEKQIQEMLIETVKSGDITIMKVDDQYRYSKKFIGKDGKEHLLHVAVSDRPNNVQGIGKGNIISAFPEKIVYSI